MKTVKLKKFIQGYLPDGVIDTGRINGKDDQWCIGHIYEIDEKKHYINLDFFEEIEEKSKIKQTKEVK